MDTTVNTTAQQSGQLKRYLAERGTVLRHRSRDTLETRDIPLRVESETLTEATSTREARRNSINARGG